MFYIRVDVNSRSRPSLPICPPLIPVSSLNLCDAVRVFNVQTWNISALCKHYPAVDFRTTSARALVHMTEVISHRWKAACKRELQMMILFMFSSRMHQPSWLESVYRGQTLGTFGKYLFKLRDDTTPSGLGVKLQQDEHHAVGIQRQSRDKCLLTSVHDTFLESWFSSPSSSLYIQAWQYTFRCDLSVY